MSNTPSMLQIVRSIFLLLIFTWLSTADSIDHPTSVSDRLLESRTAPDDGLQSHPPAGPAAGNHFGTSPYQQRLLTITFQATWGKYKKGTKVKWNPSYRVQPAQGGGHEINGKLNTIYDEGQSFHITYTGGGADTKQSLWGPLTGNFTEQDRAGEGLEVTLFWNEEFTAKSASLVYTAFSSAILQWHDAKHSSTIVDKAQYDWTWVEIHGSKEVKVPEGQDYPSKA